MYMEDAAHVGHGIAHAPSKGQLIVGGAAFTVGAGVAVFTGAAEFGSAAMLVAGGVSGRIGIDFGYLMDKQVFGASITGHIATGNPTVFLGPQIRQAARAASDDTTVDCHKKRVAEGSRDVFIGPDFKPMSRRKDKTECDGVIAEGLASLSVGGAPANAGVGIREIESWAVWGMKLFFNALDVKGSLMKGKTLDNVRAAIKGLSGALDAAGDSRDAPAVKALALSKFDTSSAQAWYSTGKTLYKAGRSGIEYSAGIVSP